MGPDGSMLAFYITARPRKNRRVGKSLRISWQNNFISGSTGLWINRVDGGYRGRRGRLLQIRFRLLRLMIPMAITTPKMMARAPMTKNNLPFAPS